MAPPPAILVLENPAAVAEAAAGRIAGLSRESVQSRGRFAVVLSGGTTPRLLYARLASPPWRDLIDWSRALVFFGDERCVPPDHRDSNYRLAHETLLRHVPIPEANVHRVRGESTDPAAAAEDYEREIRAAFPHDEKARFDLVLLGLGADGHTASLFPGRASLDERSRWVVATGWPGSDVPRITLTLPALAGARRLIFLVTGRDKERIFAEVFAGAAHDDLHPAERVVEESELTEVFVDRGAASRSAS